MRAIEVRKVVCGTFLVEIVAELNHFVDQIEHISIRVVAQPVIGEAAKVADFI